MAGFTLIEVMIVVAILGIVLAMGLPSMVRTLKKEPLRQATSDIVEGLGQARAQAILRGEPWKFVLRPSDDTGVSDYELLVMSAATGPVAATGESDSNAEAGRSSDIAFRRRFGGGVMITLLEVNFRSQMQAEDARVRFFPNGTSDDFTIIIESDGRMRKIWLDPITAMADLEVIR